VAGAAAAVVHTLDDVTEQWWEEDKQFVTFC
jgi:hypothetical protein